MSLSAITGNYDRKGGQLPLTFADPSYAGDGVLEEIFALETFPYRLQKKVGQTKYPLFTQLVEQGQDMELARQILSGEPYPLRAIFAMGMNHRMFSNTKLLEQALEQVEFFVDVDIFLTDTAKLADLVLPACSSFERGTFRNYGNGKVAYTKPVIPPLYESKSDVDILCELAEALELDDPLLRSGYRNCIQWMLNQTGLTVEQLQEAGEQVPIPTFVNYTPGLNTSIGYMTLTQKFELKSKLIEQRFTQFGYDPLPVWEPPAADAVKDEYPLVLMSGGRLANAMHSRLHDSPWHRVQRPEPMVDVHPADAALYGLTDGAFCRVTTTVGSLEVKVHVTHTMKEGVVSLFQDYREANVNSIIPPDYDPYSGYPALRSSRCQIEAVKN